ncbi:hypothetical protein ATK86_7198 [Nocardia fluminea]|uniref:LppA-like lipoprotein n=1 Tax=Nocardia fluminea TaxID=134984 RepID=A0A2N3V598_9NOCA|nr:hypothetical protein ATK86_7198 [Nocardia fluminea]
MRRFRSVRRWGPLASVAISVAVCGLVAGCTPRPPYPDLTTQEERDNAQRAILGLSPVEDFDQEMIRELQGISDVLYSIDSRFNLETQPWPRRYDACDSPLHLSVGRASSQYQMRMWRLAGIEDEQIIPGSWEKLKAAMRESGTRLGFNEIAESSPTRDSDQYVIRMHNNMQGSISLVHVPNKEISISGYTGCRPSRTETAAATPTGHR